jgi:hypothetical protein
MERVHWDEMTSPRSLQISFWWKYEASKTDLVEAQKREISPFRAHIVWKWWSTPMRYMAAMNSSFTYGGDPVNSSTTVLPTL